MAVFSHSKTLFIKDNVPLRFWLRPSADKEKIRKLIENGGGMLVSKMSPNAIRLAEPNSKVLSEGVISTRFIVDCVKHNTLLHADAYRVCPSEIEAVSDFSDVENPPVFVRTHVRRGAQQYTRKEEEQILHWICSNRRYSEVKGRKMWEVMERSGVIQNRTWQSLKERFVKKILPNIKHFSNMITSKQMSYFSETFSNEQIVTSTTNGTTTTTSPSQLSTDDEVSPSDQLRTRIQVSNCSNPDKLFTRKDDMAIVKCVLESISSQSIRGNHMWQMMEKQRVTSHSWQSMKERFLKRILRDLHTYDLTEAQRTKLLRRAGKPANYFEPIPSSSPLCRQRNRKMRQLKIQTVTRKSPRKTVNGTDSWLTCSTSGDGGVDAVDRGNESRVIESTAEPSVMIVNKTEPSHRTIEIATTSDDDEGHMSKKMTRSPDWKFSGGPAESAKRKRTNVRRKSVTPRKTKNPECSFSAVVTPVTRSSQTPKNAECSSAAVVTPVTRYSQTPRKTKNPECSSLAVVTPITRYSQTPKNAECSSVAVVMPVTRYSQTRRKTKNPECSSSAVVTPVTRYSQMPKNAECSSAAVVTPVTRYSQTPRKTKNAKCSSAAVVTPVTQYSQSSSRQRPNSREVAEVIMRSASSSTVEDDGRISSQHRPVKETDESDEGTIEDSDVTVMSDISLPKDAESKDLSVESSEYFTRILRTSLGNGAESTSVDKDHILPVREALMAVLSDSEISNDSMNASFVPAKIQDDGQKRVNEGRSEDDQESANRPNVKDKRLLKLYNKNLRQINFEDQVYVVKKLWTHPNLPRSIRTKMKRWKIGNKLENVLS